jgi:hypothetical protein
MGFKSGINCFAPCLLARRDGNRELHNSGSLADHEPRRQPLPIRVIFPTGNRPELPRVGVAVIACAVVSALLPSANAILLIAGRC